MNRPPEPQMGRLRAQLAAFLAFSGLWLVVGCSDDEEAAGPTSTGQACATADQCYPSLKGELSSEAVCLDRIEGGYCTHRCATDRDCCAAEGECTGPYAEVCSPFESTDDLYCFISCEDADWEGVTFSDADAYCQRYAGQAFHCRSTGGGSANRKVCTP